jgi:hypothetical protein
LGNVYPVIEFPYGNSKLLSPTEYEKHVPTEQKPSLEGASVKKGFDCHYSVVRPWKNSQKVFVPALPEEAPLLDQVFDEFVIFNESQALPMYIVYVK